MISLQETTTELLNTLSIKDEYRSDALTLLESGDSRYLKDLKVNLSNVLDSEYLTTKETALIALSISANANNSLLIEAFRLSSEKNGAQPEEIAESIACASLLASNNVFYRFRHFISKESYNKKPAKIKMNIMMRPLLGKELFELISLAVSAVNGCEMCVKAHEGSLMDLGSSEDRIWETVRLASVITSLTKVIR